MPTALSPPDVYSRSWRAGPAPVGEALTFSDYKAPPHVRLISWLLMMNAYKFVPRLGISLPPGSGKSEIVDHWNPVWLLDADPGRRIVLASYAGLLAEEQGKRVRNTIENAADVLRVRIMQDTRAAASWKTSAGGGMWTVGIGGTLTGRRASNMFIDDPHKNWSEAMSEKNQMDTWNWYTSTARTRLLPRAPLAVIQTRWNENDLLGKLMAQDDAVSFDHRSKWLFVSLPAIADRTETIRTVIGPDWAQRLERQGIVLPEWHREQGEALWPELEPGVPWFDEEEYAQIRAEVGEMIWAGLYQQRPAPLEGIMFKRDRWVMVDAVPSGATTRVRRWDLAATADPSADATASCLMTYHHPTKTLYIEDMTRDRLESTDVELLVRQTALADRDRYGQVHIRIEREPGSSGKGQESNYLRNVLPEFGPEFFPSTGSKEVRAIPFAGQQGARQVHLCRRFDGDRYEMPGWWQWLIEEAAVFPHGAHDDLVDSAAAAYVDLLDLIPRRSRARAQSSARKTLGI